MLCTPALFSLPVGQAWVQVAEGGTREVGGTSSSSSNSSNSNPHSSSSMATQHNSVAETGDKEGIVGTILAQIHLGRGVRFLR